MNPDAPIPFEEFMRRALYDPRRGYYSRRITGVGKRGDFTTAPMLSDALGIAIARWAARALGESGCRNLIEIGPGEGRLARVVWKHLPWFSRWRTRLHLVETSGPLAAIQKETLGDLATWHESPREALDCCGGHAVIYSNELVDAFPVRVFQKSGESWREVGVSIGADGGASEILLSPALPPESTVFAHDHRDGQRVEVHESYRCWLHEWLPLWKRGRMLTIDYGGPAEALYQRRPHGTVRAYLFQQRLEGAAVYQHIGRQDLTADVNFSDVMAWSRPWMKHQRLESLSAFLGNENAGGLWDAQGAGEAFQVLEEWRAD